MNDSDKKTTRDGIARIKSQYVVVKDVKNTSDPTESNGDVHKIESDAGAEPKCNGDTKRDVHKIESDAGTEPKWKKRKGMNKKRPRPPKLSTGSRLCFNFRDEQICHREKCKYSHDVEEFLKNKPPDLNDSCYVYNKYGKCASGVTCRFGSEHITDDGKNKVDVVKWDSNSCNLTSCVLTSDVQWKLRKNKYDFSKSDVISDAYFKLREQYKTSARGTQFAYPAISEGTITDSLKIKREHTDSIKDMADPTKIIKVDEANPTIKVEETNSTKIEVDESDSTKIKVEPVSAYSDKFPHHADTETPISPKLLLEEPKQINGNSSNDISTETTISADLPKIILEERKQIDWNGKLYLAPLTTVGNLPFRRVCKSLGADITCSEMAMASSLLQGKNEEWALVRRHESEDLYGVQICGSNPRVMTRCAQLLQENANMDFIDINAGCPLDDVYKKGAGSGLLHRVNVFDGMLHCMSSVMTVPLTIKIRAGIKMNCNIAHTIIPKLKLQPISLITLHARSREQRYTKMADWKYMATCAAASQPHVPLYGNGDVLSYEDYNAHMHSGTGIAGVMIGRGALIKPWLFREIKEQRHIDMSSGERLDMLREFVNYGLEHWGSDTTGVEKTRRFLLEWLSFLCRYIPVGLLEVVPQRMNARPVQYFGRDDLETLMASPNSSDWVKISEMLLGPVPEEFIFVPKHRANAWS